MPYERLPARLRQIIPDEKGQEIFRRTFNSQMKSGKSESVSFATAWAKLKDAGYKKDEGGKYTKVEKSSGAKPLYMKRKVLNAEKIIEWAKSQGIATTLEPDDMHVTVIYSKEPFSREYTQMVEHQEEAPMYYGNHVVRGGKRSVERLGENGEAIVLKIECPKMASEHYGFRAMGASSDWPDYKPHITISWQADDFDETQAEPFGGDIVLSDIYVSLLDEDWKSKVTEKSRKDTLRDKVDEWNEKYGERHGRVTVGMLEDVYDRGIGAYRTNPESVRPNVKSKEQWAFARVNSFLDAARGAKSINHDQDIHDKIKKSQPTVSDVHVPSTDSKEIDKDEDSFKPPAGARAAARRALRWREKHGDKVRGGTRVGWTRANQLANGENLSRETVARMASFFARHEGNEKVDPKFKDEPWRDAGFTSFNIWGGSTGREWSRRIMDRLEKSDPVKQGLLEKAVSSIIGAIMQHVDVNKSVEDAAILKMDDEQRIVYGWASVVTEDGEPVVDTQGDVISPSEMEKMANDFMLDVRKAKAMHTGGQIGEVIHSMPLTNELMKAFDIYSDKEGWLIAMKIYDDEAWAGMKKGRFSGFSIGGKAGSREAIE